MSNQCPLCGGNVAYLGVNTVECRTPECMNGPKLDVPTGYEIGWYYVNDDGNGVTKMPFLKKIEEKSS